MESFDEDKLIEHVATRRALLGQLMTQLPDGVLKQAAEQMFADTEGLPEDLRQSLADAREAQKKLDADYKEAEKKAEKLIAETSVLFTEPMPEPIPGALSGVEPKLADRLRKEIVGFFADTPTDFVESTSLPTWAFESTEVPADRGKSVPPPSLAQSLESSIESVVPDSWSVWLQNSCDGSEPTPPKLDKVSNEVENSDLRGQFDDWMKMLAPANAPPPPKDSRDE